MNYKKRSNFIFFVDDNPKAILFIVAMKKFSILLLLVGLVFACGNTVDLGNEEEEGQQKRNIEQLAWFHEYLGDGSLTYEELLAKTTIDLRNKGIKELPDGIFADLSNLETLYLSDNSLTTLPAGILDDLDSLETLYLSNNDLESLPDGIFAKLNKLETLDIGEITLGYTACNVSPNPWFVDGSISIDKPNSYVCTETEQEREANQLAWFQEKLEEPTLTRAELLAMEDMEITQKSITELPDGIFDNLSSLTWLDLEGNYLTSLPAGIFDDLSSLTYLSLSENSLTSLATGVFDNLSRLTDLSLGGNSLTSLCQATIEMSPFSPM